jgi:hypothetical protein
VEKELGPRYMGSLTARQEADDAIAEVLLQFEVGPHAQWGCCALVPPPTHPRLALTGPVCVCVYGTGVQRCVFVCVPWP